MNEQSILFDGIAFDNFINAVKAKASKRFYLVGLRKFMAYNNIQNQNVGDLIAWELYQLMV
jgi:hypothetical protein